MILLSLPFRGTGENFKTTNNEDNYNRRTTEDRIWQRSHPPASLSGTSAWCNLRGCAGSEFCCFCESFQAFSLYTKLSVSRRKSRWQNLPLYFKRSSV